MSPPFRSRARRAGIATWCCYALLVGQQALDAWLLHAPGIVWLAKLLPLLLFLPWMLRNNLRSFLWLCFVSLGYFIVLVQRQFAQPGNSLVTLGLVAVVALFVSAMLFVRWRARSLAAESGSGQAS